MDEVYHTVMRELLWKKQVREDEVAVVDPEAEEDHQFRGAVIYAIIVIKKDIMLVNVKKKDLIEGLTEISVVEIPD